MEWIDGIAGKTKALNVAKVIAVASSGFASSAIKKTKENSIETLTLKEAGDQDWTLFPIKPDLLLVSDKIYFINQVFYKACDEFRPIDDLGLNCEVELDGEPVGDLAGLTEHFFKEHVIPGV